MKVVIVLQRLAIPSLQFCSASDYGFQDDETDETEAETDQSRFLGTLVTQTLHPPTATDAPPLSLPPDTEIVLAEETQSGWSNIYRGTVATTGQDTVMLNKVMPMWLLQYLLTNKIPIVPNIKVSFGVVAWPGKTSGGDLPTDTQNPYVRIHLFTLASIWLLTYRITPQTIQVDSQPISSCPEDIGLCAS